MEKSKKIVMAVLLVMSIGCIGNAKVSSKSGKFKNVKRPAVTSKNSKSSSKELNSEEYAKVLDNFMKKAEKYLETGDKIRLVDDYINDIENAKVSKKALEDNYDADKEAFGMVEVAIFMKSSYSSGEKAKKLTDADYERIQKKFTNTSKFKQLEGYVKIQPVSHYKFNNFKNSGKLS